MKERFFGLKKEPIKKTIKKLEWDFHSEKGKLEYELLALEKENDQYRKQIQKLKKEKNTTDHDDEFWKLAKNRLNKVINHLSKQKEMEIIELRNSSDKRIAHVKKQISELEDEINATQQLIEKMLNQFSTIVDGVSDNQMLNKGIDLTQKLEDKSLESQTISQDLFEATSKIEEEQNSEKAGIEEAELIRDDMDTDHHDFWGNLTNLQNDDHLFNNEEIILETIDTDFHVQDEIKHSESEPEINKTNDNQTKPNKHLEQPIGNTDSIVEQINTIKSQYIVGKVAGEDLFDQKGNLIIKRNTKITPEVVEKANKEGKLAELIVNMKISGLGEN